jgi:hypothetical protein
MPEACLPAGACYQQIEESHLKPLAVAECLDGPLVNEDVLGSTHAVRGRGGSIREKGSLLSIRINGFPDSSQRSATIPP